MPTEQVSARTRAQSRDLRCGTRLAIDDLLGGCRAFFQNKQNKIPHPASSSWNSFWEALDGRIRARVAGLSSKRPRIFFKSSVENIRGGNVAPKLDEIQVGNCSITRKLKIRRVLEITESGRVIFEVRGGSQGDKWELHDPCKRPPTRATFASQVVRRVRCDWDRRLPEQPV